jgi:diguanylate cyclase (GGDEF)-like protein
MSDAAFARALPWAMLLALGLTLSGRVRGAEAQPDIPLSAMLHESWQPEDGLPQSAIASLLLSSDGYLWMGTQLGLVRFNGADFHLLDRHSSPGMSTSVVTDLLESPGGGLYAGLNGGGVVSVGAGSGGAVTAIAGLEEAKVIDLELGADGALLVATLEGVVRLAPGSSAAVPASDLPSTLLHRMARSRDGTLWFAPRAGGLLSKRPGLAATQVPGLGDRQVLSMVETRAGALLLGTDHGLLALQEGQAHQPYGRGLPDDLTVTALLEGADGALWVGTQEHGVWRVSNWGAERFSTRDGLGADNVTAIVEDREGSIWIGTHGGGLSRLRRAAIASYPAVQPWVVLEDGGGRLWMGGSSGLHQLRRGGLVSFPGQHVIDDTIVGSMLEARDGSLWVGSLGEGLIHLVEGEQVLRLDSHDGLPGDKIFALDQSPEDGAIWMGTDGGVARLSHGDLRVWNTDDGLSAAKVRVIHFDGSGTLWACTDGDGCYTLQGDRFVQVAGSEELSAPYRLVTNLHEDPEGGLWLGTDGGLLHWHAGQFFALGSEHGLPMDGFYRVLEDDEGVLWISGNRGVFAVERAQLEATVEGRARRAEGKLFGQAQGMRWLECNGGSHPAGWRDRTGTLWFPTTGGLVAIDPDRLVPNRYPPPVHIESLRVEDEPVSVSTPGTFPPGTGKLTFDYAALSYTGPDQVRYRVKLDGLDSDWVERGGERFVYYHTLPPGRYTFRVIAANSDGVWNEQGDSYGFEIQPALHQRAEVRALAALVLALLAIGLPVVRIRQLIHRKAELEAAVAERTRELKELSLRDPLTGLRNRRFLWEVVPQGSASFDGQEDTEDRRSARLASSTGFLMLDIDHFKQVNDTHGHATGDHLLQAVAELLRGSARTDDIVVRWGGEEFLLVLPRTSPTDLGRFAQRLRASVAALEIEAADGSHLRRTCSIGICHHPFHPAMDIEQVIAVADVALYRAKQGGRDRVVQVLPGPYPPRDDDQRRLIVADPDEAADQGLIIIDEPDDA